MYQVFIKICIILCLCMQHAQAEEQIFQEGVHYDRLEPAVLADERVQQQIAQDRGKVQIVEFFNYGCAWCGQIYEPITTWAANKKHVSIYSYPAVFNNIWRKLGKIYFAVQQFDNSLEIDLAIFDAVHTQHLPVWREAVLKPIITKYGVDSELLLQHINSLVTDSKVKKAEILADAYKIDSTPYIIIHGAHGSYTTNLAKTQSKELLIDVIDYLVMREQKFL